MKRVVRRIAVAVGSGGLLLAGAAPASALSTAWSSGYSGRTVQRGTWAETAVLHCKGGKRSCAKGPVKSGNSKNSFNIDVKGPANNVGNLNIVEDSTNSKASDQGTQSNSNNSVQTIR